MMNVWACVRLMAVIALAVAAASRKCSMVQWMKNGNILRNADQSQVVCKTLRDEAPASQDMGVPR